ncbi:MAG: DUF4118 domain-containing protein [Hyphomicrobiales bacterium]|nr:DUF4118 domain-containing protein [Hyphomicrobiales bacterium]
MAERKPTEDERTRSREARPGDLFVALLAAAVAVAAAIPLGFRLAAVLPPGWVVSVFLVAVLAAAALFGLWSGLAAAIGGFFAFNWFFVEPTYTFDVADPREVFALGVFLAAAILTGGLAGRLRETADAARRRADALALVAEFAERLASATTVDDVRLLAVRHLAAAIDGGAMLFDRRDGHGEVVAAWPDGTLPSEAERAAVDRVFAARRPVVETTPRFVFRPLPAADRVETVIGLGGSDGRAPADDDHALAALIGQAAAALERAHVAEERAAAEAAAEQERLRSALLSSISHDLRTPLATILGSVTSLRQLGDQMEPADRADLLAAIEEETDRLSRFVADLLAMTRLEAGLDLRRDWVDLGDALAAAALRLRRAHPGHVFRLRLDAVATIRSDATLLEQVIFNLGDNAAKASEAGLPIDLRLARDGESWLIEITDRGRGLAPPALARLFGPTPPRAIGLSPEGHGGLGVAIARRVVAACGGTIAAESPTPEGPGTRVSLRLPIDAPPPVPEAETPEA